MAISRSDVLHVAKLAKLRLEDAEIEPIMADLGKILGYVELLNELDTSGVPPMSHVTVTQSPLRDDRVHPVVTTDEVLAEAPRRSGDGFAVPAFVDEG
jgi:aspartyl-tRNA(Asn)/glutamyl-tRNA(Gln) amidotransferase subunit C